MAHFDSSGNPIWVPLSGGYDSRLVLAAANAAGLNCHAFTHVKPARIWSHADRTLPPKLAAAIGIPHSFLYPTRRATADRYRAIHQHTSGEMKDRDREFIARGQWDQVPRDAVVLRGGAFEVGRARYWKRLPVRHPDNPSAHAETIVQGLAQSPVLTPMFMRWTEWTALHPDLDIDWRDRLYLEGRLGGWLAIVEQALDLVPVERLVIANCRALFRALLAVPPATRAANDHHRALIKTLCPPLAELPFNPTDPRAYRIVRRISRAKAARTWRPSD